MEDWAVQYEDDPALRESPAQKEVAQHNEWRRDGLQVTKGNTTKFAEAHSTLREAAGQFYIINGATLALPSLLELLVACRNFATPCGAGVAVLMALDGGICIASNLISLWLCKQREVLQDRKLQEHILRTARGDGPADELLSKKAKDFNKAASRAVWAMLSSMGVSLLLWIIGLFILLCKDLSPCPEVKSWLRFVLWLRALMPLMVLCCIIPIQQLCCEASCFSSISALHGLPEEPKESSSEASDLESATSSSSVG